MKKMLFFVFVPLLLLFTGNAWGQLSGTRTIPGDYATIAAAVADLNAHGVGPGGVTFNVAAGHTETITAPIHMTATGTAANPIVFQRSGTGANPLITAYGGGTATPSTAGVAHDGIWRFIGSDWVTIDGIDLTDPNTANPATMEYGFAFYKASPTDGCNNNTIRNCVITLQRINNATGAGPSLDGSKGINLTNSLFDTPTVAVTTTSVEGASSNNRFLNNTIRNTNLGIVLVGFAAASPFTFADTGNEVVGNTIVNFGGGGTATPAAAVRTQRQYSLNVSSNIINNNDGGGVNHAIGLWGIFIQDAPSASLDCNGNNITLHGGGTIHTVTFIENTAGSTPAGNTVNINNNTLTGSYLTATLGHFMGIWNNGATPATLNIQNNTISNLSYSAAALSGTGWVHPILTSGYHSAMTINASGNRISNITRTGSTGGITRGIFIGGPGVSGMAINVNNNIVSGMSIAGAGTASVIFGIHTMAAGTVSMNNNRIDSLTVLKTTGTGELNGIRQTVWGAAIETITNNIVHTLTHNGTGIVRGIMVSSPTGTRTMSGNLIHTLTGAGTEIAGIISWGNTPNIFNNKIYNLTSTATGAPVVSGIWMVSLLSGATANIYNNFIGDLKAPSAGGATAAAPTVRGINITAIEGTTNVNLFYNTVYLDATSTGINFGTTALFAQASTAATTANLTLANNIFVNNSVSNGVGRTVAYQRSAVDLANYHTASNNNLFFAGTPGVNNLIFFDGTNSDQTIDAFKARVSPRESVSFSENPVFQSTVGSSDDYLKISLAVPTQIESGGRRITSPVAITNDFFGTVRALEAGYTGAGAAPDIGAFEGAMIPLDLSPPSISFTPLSNTLLTTDRTLVATITDPSGVPTTAPGFPHLYWRINVGSWQAATPVEVSGNNFTFNFGAGAAVGDSISYYIVAQDNAVPPNIAAMPPGGAGGFTANPPAAAIPPVAPSMYRIVSVIGGALTVGPGGNYSTLTGPGGLFAAINGSIVNANITVTILGDLTEPGTHALNQWLEDPPGNFTLTIRPAPGTTPTVSGTFAGGLIRLNGADRVTIDGSNAGGTDRSLTIQNNSNLANTAAIQIISLGAGMGATNITIQNCNIKAGEIGSTTALNTFGIYAADAAISSAGAGADNDNLTIQNNAISKARFGIYARGSSVANANDNLMIIGNSIGSDIATEFVTFRGIDITNALGPVISQNTIFNMRKTLPDNNAAMDFGTGVNNALITRNRITGIHNESTAGWGAWGINFSSVADVNNNLIANNTISDIRTVNAGAASTTFNAFGIRLTGGTNTRIFYNSVSLDGTITIVAGTPAQPNSAALIVTSTAVTGLEVVNNVLVNNQVFVRGTPRTYSIWVPAGFTGFAAINHNNYFGTTTAPTTYHVGRVGAVDFTTLAAWQGFTTRDANSISANPMFVSATNLQPFTGSPLLATGTPVAGVTTDFTGTARSATTPSIGAFETGVVPPAVDWCNLQWPPTATITEGGSVAVFAQVWEPGVTNFPGQGAGIEAWIGWHSANTDPATWPAGNWVPAVYNVDVGNNDEYMATIGSGLPHGTYYFASRFRIANGLFQYGGYTAGGGNFWGVGGAVSGVLTVNELLLDIPYTQTFDAATFPPKWTQTFAGGLTSNRWKVHYTSGAGGTPNEMWATQQNQTGTSRLIAGRFNTAGMTALSLNFRMFFHDNAGGLTMKIQSSADGITWTDEAFSFASGGGFIWPVEVNTTILHNLGAATFIAWVIEGNHDQFFSWVIDNVEVRLPNMWTGTTSTEWTTAGNWSQGVPLAAHVAVIPDVVNQPVISTTATVSNLIINAGASFDIAPTGQLTVSSNLINNAGNTGLVLQSTAAGTGSLIHTTPGIAATMERFFSGFERWRLVASPVANQAIGGPWTPPTPNHGYDFYDWREQTSTWRNQKVAANNITQFVPGRGYLVSFQGADLTQSFAGALNHGNITVPVTRLNTGAFRGANLLGNPYPSSIDWHLADRTRFADHFAYIYDPLAGNGGSYVTVNGAVAGALIAPNQGFFVLKRDPGTASFTFTNAMRVHGGEFKSVPANPTITITLQKGEFYDRAQIVQLQGATTARERSDALKFFSYNPMMPQVFTMSSDAMQLAVNSTPTITEDASFTIGVLTPVTGTYTLKVDGLQEILAGRPAFLLDKVTGVSHNLREQSRISFHAVQSSTAVERFVLSFVQPTGVGNLPEDATVVYFANGRLFMQFAAEDRNRQLQVIDLTGRVVLSKSLHGMGNMVSVPLQIDNGVYIVRITGETSAINRRILVR